MRKLAGLILLTAFMVMALSDPARLKRPHYLEKSLPPLAIRWKMSQSLYAKRLIPNFGRRCKQ